MSATLQLPRQFEDLTPPVVKSVNGVIGNKDTDSSDKEAVIIICHREKEDLILAVHRKDNPADWGFPGGKVEQGESPFRAAMRELEEETCYTVSNEEYMHFIETRMDREYKVHVYFVFEKDLAIHTGPSEQNYAWVKEELLLTGTFGDFNTKLKNDWEQFPKAGTLQ